MKTPIIASAARSVLIVSNLAILLFLRKRLPCGHGPTRALGLVEQRGEHDEQRTAGT